MFKLALIAATLAVALLSPAHAQSRRDMREHPAPPPVVSQSITAARGAKVTVPLAIHGTRGELLEFLIRTPPAHGKLSAVQSTGMNTASVTYTPSAKSTAAEDRFAYAVRGSEGVSAAGVIAIRFIEPPTIAPKLKAPFDLEFPAVFPGQRSTVELEIANEGGGFLEGEVAVPEPWSIEGLKIFKVAAGRSTTIKLVFTTTQPGVRTGEAVISGTERKVIPLRATAEDRLAATPAQLKLTAQPGSQTRTGALKIENRSAEDATILLDAGPRLLMDRTVKVPARGTASVPVFADAATGTAFDETVKLSSNEWKASVAVHAVAVGAILKFTADEVSIAGRAGSAAASATAILENSGGEAVTLRLDVGSPFELESRVVTAPARGSVEIPILVRAAAPGTFRSTMKASGDGGSALVQVKAEISEAAEAAEPRAPLLPQPSSARAENSAAENSPAENEPSLIPQSLREIPNALGKFARGTGTDTAVLDWPEKLGPSENARVEERVLAISDNGDLQVTWSPLADAGITHVAGHVAAELRGLRHSTLYTVRVVTGAGADAAVLFTTDFRTAVKKPLYEGSLLTPLLVLALLVLLYAIWRSYRVPRKKRK